MFTKIIKLLFIGIALSMIAIGVEARGGGRPPAAKQKGAKGKEKGGFTRHHARKQGANKRSAKAIKKLKEISEKIQNLADQFSQELQQQQQSSDQKG